jgi:hypothetical protein
MRHPCPQCDGGREAPGGRVNCETCHGTGTIARGGKLPVSTSLTARDLDRIRHLAEREKISLATWIRRVVVRELDKVLPTLMPLACSACGHGPNEHSRDGCGHEDCRCHKYRGGPR